VEKYVATANAKIANVKNQAAANAQRNVAAILKKVASADLAALSFKHLRAVG